MAFARVENAENHMIIQCPLKKMVLGNDTNQLTGVHSN